MEHTYKIVILGDSGIGKSSFITRYVHHKYYEYQEPTIGASYFSKRINYNNINLKLNIWDTAGQERYKSLAPMYYRNSNIVIIAYDITNKDSFKNAQKWVDEIKLNVTDPIIYLIGTKFDIEYNRDIEWDVIKNYADKNKLKVFETSAKNSKNINLVFEDIINTLIKLKPTNTHIIDDFYIKKSTKKCCN